MITLSINLYPHPRRGTLQSVRCFPSNKLGGGSFQPVFVLYWATFAAVAEVVDGGDRTMGLVVGGCAPVGWAAELRIG